MRNLIITIICLIAMVTNANAQFGEWKCEYKNGKSLKEEICFNITDSNIVVTYNNEKTVFEIVSHFNRGNEKGEIRCYYSFTAGFLGKRGLRIQFEYELFTEELMVLRIKEFNLAPYLEYSEFNEKYKLIKIK